MRTSTTYLVDRRLDLGTVEKNLQMLRLEIRDADALGKTVHLQCLHLLPRLSQVRMVVRHVNEEEIDVVCSELAEALLEGVANGLTVGHLVELGADVELRPRHARCSDTGTDALFVGVHLSGVDVPEPGLDSVGYLLSSVLLPERSAGTEGEPRHGSAVIERNGERSHDDSDKASVYGEFVRCGCCARCVNSVCLGNGRRGGGQAILYVVERYTRCQCREGARGAGDD